MSIRSVHEQVIRLLSSSEQNEMRLSDAFAPFAGQNPLQYNPYTEPLWKAAVAQYDRAMSPAEQRIAGKLRSQFRAVEGNPQQVRGPLPTYMVINGLVNYMPLLLQFQLHNWAQKLTLSCHLIL